MRKLKLASFFSGIGAFEKALGNLGTPYELVAYCEIDKYASKSYSAIHGVPETMNLGDITKVDATKLPKDISCKHLMEFSLKRRWNCDSQANSIFPRMEANHGRFQI